MRKCMAIFTCFVYIFLTSSYSISLDVFATNNVQSTDSEISVSANSAILIEAETGTILFEKNAYMKREMASTTKIMTTLLTLESGNLDEYFVVDPLAVNVEGTSMGLLEGDSVTKRILCYGMMLPSGNDAANAAAIKISGSLEKFADLMNKRAREIGMKNTNFVTPSGLDDYTDNHYSTAYDMALLTKEALKNQLFAEICSSSKAKVTYGKPPYDRWLKNSNKMLASYEDSIGVKTGFTDKAKRCLVSAAERDGVKLIVVTLNAPNDWADHTKLLDYGFEISKKSDLPTHEGEILANVVGGESDTVLISPLKNPTAVINGYKLNDIRVKIIRPYFTYAPIIKGERVGIIEYYLNNTLIASSPLVATKDVALKKGKSEKDFFKGVKDFFSSAINKLV